jgi:hypothetical protein
MKAKIAEGYPKLAQYIGPTWDINDPNRRTRYYPSKPRGYNDVSHKMQHGEIIVLANRNEWRDDEFHFVPLKLLEERRVPINSVLTWKSDYVKLPRLHGRDFVVL